jgi:hypothetical protein
MKKILFVISILAVLSGCAPVKTTLKGEIIAYNSDGTILKRWNNIIIEESVNSYVPHTNAIKTFGLNFYDPATNKYVVLGNAIPYIIHYDVTTTTDGGDPNYKQRVDDLNSVWKSLKSEIKSIRQQMQHLNKDSKEYDILNEKLKDLKHKKSEIEKQLWNTPYKI